MTAYHYETDILTADTPGPDLCVRIEDLFPAEAGAGVGQSTLDTHALSVDLAIDAAGAREAEDYAVKLIRDALAAAHVTPGEMLAKRLIRWDLFERETNEPNYPDIVNAAEAAEILGVSRQRVHQLLRENSRFPEPLYHLRGTGPLWDRPGIKAFARKWDRKPGRPLRAASAS